MSLSRLPGLELRIILGLWLLHGLLVNSGDVEAYALQHAGIEAIVERHQVSLGDSSTPQFRSVWDAFEFGEHRYAAKQPGQFFLGALAYFFVHALSLSYSEHYRLAGALNTFLTAGLLAAAAGTALFMLARAWAPAGSRAWPWLALLSFSVGSFMLPYSGVMHHGALATSYLVLALFALVEARRQDDRRLQVRAAAAIGVLLGLAIATSMLPFFPTVALGLAACLGLGVRGLPPLLAGGGLGLLPLLIYDWVNFGHPLLVPNVAGGFSDTFLLLDWRNFAWKARYYAIMLTLYAPVMWLGLLGLPLFPRRLRFEQLTLLAMHLALVGYVFNIETIGGCQFGPRYLLPLTPFTALGLVGFSHRPAGAFRRAAAVVVGLALAVSTAINLLGALYGTMYCELGRYAISHYLDAIRHHTFRGFPLALPLALPIGLWFVPIATQAAERLLARLDHRSGDESPAP